MYALFVSFAVKIGLAVNMSAYFAALVDSKLLKRYFSDSTIVFSPSTPCFFIVCLINLIFIIRLLAKLVNLYRNVYNIAE